MGLQRLHALAVVGFGTLTANTQHLGLRRAVNVGVEHADGGAFGDQRQGQVDGRRALADTALAGSHGDDVLHPGQQLDALLHRVGDDLGVHVGADVTDAGNSANLSNHRLTDRVDLGLCRIAQLDVEGHVGAADAQVLHCAGGDVILAGIGVGQLLEAVEDALFTETHGVRGRRAAEKREHEKRPGKYKPE